MLHVQNVSKSYRLYARPVDRLIEALPFSGKRASSEFWALRDVSIDVERGEVFGVIGANGSGKSTLLQVVAGILQPTEGRVETKGRIAALLELGAGFNPEFTGRENVYLNGEILGLSRRYMEEAFPAIERFAEIGKFIDRPVKEYSSGMYVRLAFSTAIHVDPEILIVDEALAVGDAIFANRCIKKFEELKQRGITVLFVSHDLALVKRLCDRAALMVDGRVAASGKPSDVVNRYMSIVLERQDREGTNNTGSLTSGASFRHGDGASRITEVSLRNATGAKVEEAEPGQALRIHIEARAERDIETPVVGVLVRNRLGIDVWGTNNVLEGVNFGKMRAGESFEVDFCFDCELTRQDYTVTVATQYPEGHSQDWLDDALAFRVIDTNEVAGFARFKTKVEWRRL